MPHKDAEAVKEYRKIWREKNRESIRVKHKIWRELNREHVNEKAKQYRRNNSERRSETQRKYREKNKERIKCLNAKRYNEKRADILEYMRKWRTLNKERVAEKTRAWAEANRAARAAVEQNRRARKLKAGGVFCEEDVNDMFLAQLGACLCGADLTNGFHVDHKTPIAKGGSNWPDNLQLLCPPCNLEKHAKTMAEWAAARKDLKMSRSEDVKTPECTFAYAHSLFEPQERDNGKKQFGCSLLFKKGTDLSALQEIAVAAAVDEWGEKAKDWIKSEVIKSPFLDGDGKQAVSKKTGERHAGFAGHTFIRVISGEAYKPKIFDRKRNPIMDKADVPSGSRGFAVVNAFTWENKENGKGISFGISLAQVTHVAQGDEVLGGGGGPDPDQFFEKIEDDGEAPASTKSGAGAAGLFG